MDWDAEADVVVVGAGGCGLMAAVTAATFQGGADVILLEKDSRVTPSSAISAGLLQAAGTRYQRAAGIADSPELMAEDITRKNKGKSNTEVTLAVCRKSADVVHWLADFIGLPMELAPEVDWLGHSVTRMHAHPKRWGAPLLQALRERVNALPNITYADQTPGQGLITDERGAVIGVLAGLEGETQRIRAGRVVLAAGGYGGNREMLAEFIPSVLPAPYVGSQAHTGEAIRWGIQVGADVKDMGAYQGHGYTVHGYGTRVTPGVVYDGGIVVDLSGRRFEHEDQGYSDWTGVLLRQPGNVAIALWDRRIHQRVERTDSMAESMHVGAIVQGEQVEDIARHWGIEEKVLVETLAEYNRGVEAGHDSLGRKLLVQPLRPPFYSAKITGALAHTQGGLKIDVHGRVLRPDGTPVPNLYAGGNSAVGLSGNAGDGYTSGNGLLMAYTMGKIIGEHSVTSLKGEA